MKKTIFSIVKITAVFLFFLLCLNALGQTNQQVTQERKPEENTKPQQPETPISSPEIRKKENTESVAVPSPTFDYPKDLEEIKLKDAEVKRQIQNSYPTPQPLPTFDFIGETEKLQREQELEQQRQNLENQLEQQPLFNDQNPENQLGSNSDANLTNGTSGISNVNTEKEKSKKRDLPWLALLLDLLFSIGLIGYSLKKNKAVKFTRFTIIVLSLWVVSNLLSALIHIFNINAIPNTSFTPLTLYQYGQDATYSIFYALTSIGRLGIILDLIAPIKNVMSRFAALLVGGFGMASIYYIGASLAGFETVIPIAVSGIATGATLIIMSFISLILNSDKKDDFHGSAKFAEQKDLATFEKPTHAGFILAPADPSGKHKQIYLSRDLTIMHGLILGGSGTGKSRGYFMPNCAEVKNTSIVVTDPKSELWKYTSGFHKKALRFAPSEPDSSQCFNWIPLCTDARMSELCARAIMTAGKTTNTDQFWIDAETAFLSAIFAHTAVTKYPTPLTAYRLFTRKKPDELSEILLNSPSYVAREQAIVFEQTDARIKGAIVPAVASRMQFMRDSNIQLFTSAQLEAPNFGRLRHTPTAVYWCLREQDIARLRPLTSLFFTIILEQIAGEEVSEGVGGIPINMMLDEFANIGKIPDFETTISLARGRGVALWLGIQSLSQLNQTYGDHAAQTIVSNCATKIALHGLDYQTAEYVSKMLGEKTVTHRRSSFGIGGGGFSIGSSGAEHRRQLLTADEVMRVEENEAIVRVSNKYPMKLYKGYYDKPPKTFPITTSLFKVQGEDENPENEILI